MARVNCKADEFDLIPPDQTMGLTRKRDLRDGDAVWTTYALQKISGAPLRHSRLSEMLCRHGLRRQWDYLLHVGDEAHYRGRAGQQEASGNGSIRVQMTTLEAASSVRHYRDLSLPGDRDKRRGSLAHNTQKQRNLASRSMKRRQLRDRA
jgi:hypothetical protein